MGWHRHRCRACASACALLFVVGACGPTGGGAPESPGGEDTTAQPLDDGADQDGGVDTGGDDGGGDDGGGDTGGDDGGDDGGGDGGDGPRVVLGAPFRVPSPTEVSLTGVELADRILAACEAAQPEGEPRPPGPCVEVVTESRPDPDREPGWWIETVPGGGEEVPYGGTVTVVVADETSPTGGIEPADGSGGADADGATDGSATAGGDGAVDPDGAADGSDAADPLDAPEEDTTTGEEGSGDGA